MKSEHRLVYLQKVVERAMRVQIVDRVARGIHRKVLAVCLDKALAPGAAMCCKASQKSRTAGESTQYGMM